MLRDAIDEKLGFVRFESGHPKTGWLVNMHAVRRYPSVCSSLDLDLARTDDAHRRQPSRRTSCGRLLLHRRRWQLGELYHMRPERFTDAGQFKSTLAYDPYFFIAVKVRLQLSHSATLLTYAQKGMEGQVEEWLMRKYEGLISKLERRRKEDLKLVRRNSSLSGMRSIAPSLTIFSATAAPSSCCSSAQWPTSSPSAANSCPSPRRIKPASMPSTHTPKS